MAPEILLIFNNEIKEIEFNPEKSDIFSLGISYIRLIELLTEYLLYGLNDKEGEK